MQGNPPSTALTQLSVASLINPLNCHFLQAWEQNKGKVTAPIIAHRYPTIQPPQNYAPTNLPIITLQVKCCAIMSHHTQLKAVHIDLISIDLVSIDLVFVVFIFFVPPRNPHPPLPPSHIDNVTLDKSLPPPPPHIFRCCIQIVAPPLSPPCCLRLRLFLRLCLRLTSNL